MPNTYTQLHIHFVFAVKYRQALIQPEWEDRLHKYITGIVQHNGHKMIAVNSAADHIHLFIGLNPKQSISELMRLVKGDSSEFVNKERFTPRKFHWQEGYGAFSHSHAQIDTIVKYIRNQKEHHAKKKFSDEYLKLLNDFGIEYNPLYLVTDPEND